MIEMEYVFGIGELVLMFVVLYYTYSRVINQRNKNKRRVGQALLFLLAGAYVLMLPFVLRNFFELSDISWSVITGLGIFLMGFAVNHLKPDELLLNYKK